MRELVTSPRIAAPRFRYTPCVKAGGFGLVSGMVALDPATGRLIAGGVAAQTARIFDNLALALPDYGYTLGELTLARVYLVDFARFEEFNREWERRFAAIEPPARTSIGVAALPLGAAIEIEFVFTTSGGENRT